MGVLLIIGGVSCVLLGLPGLVPELFVVGTIGAGVGLGALAWGRWAGRERRAWLLQTLQTRVLETAERSGGRLTATDVARGLDLTLSAAENLLFSMDDGVRIRSDVTDEGLLVFDFPEIRMGQRLRTPGADVRLGLGRPRA